MFRFYVDECRAVEEATSYMEIFNYSVRSVLFFNTFFYPYRGNWLQKMQLGSLTGVEWKLEKLTSLQDPFYNSCEEHPLTDDEFDNFLHRRVRSLSIDCG